MASITKPTLWSLPFLMTPRRVLIYLKEKGIPGSTLDIVPVAWENDGFVGEGKPPGSIPMLALNDGSGMIVKQSIAILEYFEELYAADTEAGKYPSLIGRTTQERAKVRQLLLIGEEVIDAFGYTYRFGSRGAAMSGRSTPNPIAARQAVSVIHEKLDILESYVDPVKENGSAMLVHLEHPKDYVCLADCVLFASLQYLKDQYEIDMIGEKYERLRLWYEEMSKRESGVVEGEYSEELKQIGREWIEGGNFWTEINKAV